MTIIYFDLVDCFHMGVFIVLDHDFMFSELRIVFQILLVEVEFMPAGLLFGCLDTYES